MIGLILSLHKSVCMIFFFPLFFFLELRFRAARLSFATVAQNSVCNYQLFFFSRAERCNPDGEGQ